MSKLSFLSARAFDAGLATLAAVSAGFVAFAMPESLFSGLVETSRLPDIVPAAQPPLGETARLAATGAASFLTFPAVWGLMALLGKAPASRKPDVEPNVEPEAEAPKLRRADAHPDAPARRPLLARDLGEPLDLEDFPQPGGEEPEIAEAGPRPLPAFLVPEPLEAEPLAQAVSQWEEPEVQSAAREPEPVEAEWQQVSEAEPEAEPEPEPEPEAWAEPAPEAEAGSQMRPISELAEQLPEADEASDQSLSQLVNRIEFGLARKRQALPAAVDMIPAEEASIEQEKVGHRLRSAINDLQKIASGGG
jgi:hypothetical protein